MTTQRNVSTVPDEDGSPLPARRKKKQDDRDYIPRLKGAAREIVLVHQQLEGYNTLSAALVSLIKEGIRATERTRLNKVGYYAQREGWSFRQMWLAIATARYEPPEITELSDEEFEELFELLGDTPPDNNFDYGDGRI